ncbi:MAG: ORF6N domain-containing protein [Bacteroidetes bacterium]|nr:ORF6N domain-containing protein [Bacteroidota bacterium]
MGAIIKIENIQGLIVGIRGQKVIIDSDVAELYGVETKRINEAVKNNPDKFPDGYILELRKDDWDSLMIKILTTDKRKKVGSTQVDENFDHLKKLKYSPYLPKAFTEKGLYMLATILKSNRATQTTIAIIETFSKIKQLSKHVKELQTIVDKNEQQNLMRRSGELITEILDDDLKISDTETSIEFNFAVVKFKHESTPKNPKRVKTRLGKFVFSLLSAR